MDHARTAVEYDLFRLVLEMATKGAHVFRLKIAEYARGWLRTLNIKEYEPSLESLNVDFEPPSEPSNATPPPQASIHELDDSNTQASVKQLPDEAWDMALKLSQQLAKNVSKINAKTPFKFSKYLEDVYERERTPQPAQFAAVASGTRSHDTSPLTKNTGSTGSSSKRKRGRPELAPSLTNDDSNRGEVDDAGHTSDSTPDDAERPAKKGRTTIPAGTVEKQVPANDRSPAGSPENVETPPSNDSGEDTRSKPGSDDRDLDWSNTVPQALVLNIQPDNIDSPKIGVWFLSSSMVSLQPLHVMTPSLLVFSLLTNQHCPKSIASKLNAPPSIKRPCPNGRSCLANSSVVSFVNAIFTSRTT